MRFLAITGIIILALLAAGWVASRLIGARMEARYPAAGEFLTINGRKVHIDDRGPPTSPAGQTIIMIHGASSNLREMLFAFADHLPPTMRLLAIDRPGHGYSERLDIEKDADIGVQARIIADTMTAKGIERAVILAHSYGGAVALRFALDYPDRVAGLVLVAPVTHPWPGGVAWYYNFTRLPIIGPIFAHAIAPVAGYFSIDAAIDSVFAPAQPPPGYRDGIGAGLVLRPYNFQANAADVASLLPQVTAQSSRYGEINTPTIIFVADADAVVSPQIHARTIAAQLPHAKLIEIKGAGHAPHQTRPDIVMPALIDFLRTVQD